MKSFSGTVKTLIWHPQKIELWHDWSLKCVLFASRQKLITLD